MVIGGLLGATLGYYIPVAIYKLQHSPYDRSELDKILDKMYGKYNVTDVLTDEILLMAYSFNEQKPRLYSKAQASHDANIYNIPLSWAAEASSATPLYFDPKVFVNWAGTQELLIDGAIIANNPSMYAFIIASQFNKKKDIRMISLGAGKMKEKTIDPNHVNAFVWLKNM